LGVGCAENGGKQSNNVIIGFDTILACDRRTDGRTRYDSICCVNI